MILDQVARIRPELAVFFGCLYYAALRPEEAVALRRDDLILPARGRGTIILTAACPRTGAAWTSTGTPFEPRGLKHRPDGTIRLVPIPPVLVSMLCRHLGADHGTTPDGAIREMNQGMHRKMTKFGSRDRYGANSRSQKLKYHVQTSGRSLHAQEMAFNDIRTTLQALCAIYDNANSLHTNAYDEAVTTPTAESVRRALAIQMIINHEWGLARNENPLQGSFIVDELTNLVEEAVLVELERISDRGGVLGAMETGYQRGRIQDESMLYESRKHDGSLPIIGVNTFRNPVSDAVPDHLELARSSEDEKQSQLRRLREFHTAHSAERPALLAQLEATALGGGNVFAVLMDAVTSCSLGEITDALFEVGGRYRRNV